MWGRMTVLGGGRYGGKARKSGTPLGETLPRNPSFLAIPRTGLALGRQAERVTKELFRRGISWNASLAAP